MVTGTSPGTPSAYGTQGSGGTGRVVQTKPTPNQQNKDASNVQPQTISSSLVGPTPVSSKSQPVVLRSALDQPAGTLSRTIASGGQVVPVVQQPGETLAQATTRAINQRKGIESVDFSRLQSGQTPTSIINRQALAAGLPPPTGLEGVSPAQAQVLANRRAQEETERILTLQQQKRAGLESPAGVPSTKRSRQQESAIAAYLRGERQLTGQDQAILPKGVGLTGTKTIELKSPSGKKQTALITDLIAGKVYDQETGQQITAYTDAEKKALGKEIRSQQSKAINAFSTGSVVAPGLSSNVLSKGRSTASQVGTSQAEVAKINKELSSSNINGPVSIPTRKSDNQVPPSLIDRALLKLLPPRTLVKGVQASQRIAESDLVKLYSIPGEVTTELVTPLVKAIPKLGQGAQDILTDPFKQGLPEAGEYPSRLKSLSDQSASLAKDSDVQAAALSTGLVTTIALGGPAGIALGIEAGTIFGTLEAKKIAETEPGSFARAKQIFKAGAVALPVLGELKGIVADEAALFGRQRLKNPVAEVPISPEVASGKNEVGFAASMEESLARFKAQSFKDLDIKVRPNELPAQLTLRPRLPDQAKITALIKKINALPQGAPSVGIRGITATQRRLAKTTRVEEGESGDIGGFFGPEASINFALGKPSSAGEPGGLSLFPVNAGLPQVAITRAVGIKRLSSDVLSSQKATDAFVRSQAGKGELIITRGSEIGQEGTLGGRPKGSIPNPDINRIKRSGTKEPEGVLAPNQLITQLPKEIIGKKKYFVYKGKTILLDEYTVIVENQAQLSAARASGKKATTFRDLERQITDRNNQYLRDTNKQSVLRFGSSRTPSGLPRSSNLPSARSSVISSDFVSTINVPSRTLPGPVSNTASSFLRGGSKIPTREQPSKFVGVSNLPGPSIPVNPVVDVGVSIVLPITTRSPVTTFTFGRPPPEITRRKIDFDLQFPQTKDIPRLAKNKRRYRPSLLGVTRGERRKKVPKSGLIKGTAFTGIESRPTVGRGKIPRTTAGFTQFKLPKSKKLPRTRL